MIQLKLKKEWVSRTIPVVWNTDFDMDHFDRDDLNFRLRKLVRFLRNAININRNPHKDILILLKEIATQYGVAYPTVRLRLDKWI